MNASTSHPHPLRKKKRGTSRALTSFLRNSYRTHISLSSLADRKSHIMIRLNSLLISILLVSFNFFTEHNFPTIFAGAIFMLTALSSLILATLSASPHVTHLNELPVYTQQQIKNMFFFGNYAHLSLEEYEDLFEEMSQDKQLIYENMSRDLYFLGKVLEKKFKLISWSYKIFTGGLIISVLSFILTLAFATKA